MFSFEGDFKTRPKVSLGGASRKEEKASLLHRTQEERKKREEERRRLKNAIIIQSFIRGYRDRKQQCSIQRTAFDRCASLAQSGGTFPLANGPNLTLLLLVSCGQTTPQQGSPCELPQSAAIWMYQNLIKHSALFVQQLEGSERLTCLFQIKRLMSLCCRHKYDHEGQKTSRRDLEKENLIICHSIEEGEENKKTKLFFPVPVHVRN